MVWDCFEELGVVVLFLGVLDLSRSEDFLAESGVVLVELEDFEVELSLAVELSFLSPTLRMPPDVSLVELVVLPSIVLFLVDKLFLISLVWFFEDWVGALMSLLF